MNGSTTSNSSFSCYLDPPLLRIGFNREDNKDIYFWKAAKGGENKIIFIKNKKYSVLN